MLATPAERSHFCLLRKEKLSPQQDMDLVISCSRFSRHFKAALPHTTLDKTTLGARTRGHALALNGLCLVSWD
jgi:hypothetical protein